MCRIITVLFITAIIFNATGLQAQANKVLWERAYAVWSAPSDSLRKEAVWEAFEGYCREGADSSSSCGMMANLLSEPGIGNASIWQHRLYNAAVYFMKHQQKEQAKFWWEAYRATSVDTSCTAQWMELMLYNRVGGSHNTTIPIHWSFCLDCLQLTAPTPNPTFTAWVNRSAYVFPGLGMLIKGYPKEGLTAFVLSVGSGYGVYRLFQKKLYWSSAGIATLFLMKFYSGNIHLTEKLKYHKANTGYNKTAAVCRQRLQDAWTMCPPLYR